MPLYMDRHDAPGATPEDTARAHAADLEVAGEFEVEFFSYWHDSRRGLVFCFARAPAKESVTGVHEAAHGLIPSEIIEVSEADVVRFLGRVSDPADTGEATSALRTICFTDLVGSTELLDRLGQADYMELLADHDSIVREALLDWGGREVKHTGDGFLVSFAEADRALRWGLDVRDAFRRHTRLSVRIGMAAGEPVDRDEDIFGAAVTLASRICDAAPAEEVFVADTVRDLADHSMFAFDAGSKRHLKGFSEPATIYRLYGRVG